jgi:hypothetical protein
VTLQLPYAVKLPLIGGGSTGDGDSDWLGDALGLLEGEDDGLLLMSGRVDDDTDGDDDADAVRIDCEKEGEELAEADLTDADEESEDDADADFTEADADREDDADADLTDADADREDDADNDCDDDADNDCDDDADAVVATAVTTAGVISSVAVARQKQMKERSERECDVAALFLLRRLSSLLLALLLLLRDIVVID